ncbi:hypothetical protein PFISCL1PPCAC_9018 [Pristionchus fissidentatus]|uniref:Thaumatin-like protein n=1 Tax=Pristionchus fissidentatus TaxID=1538716 RepID=A0AAV5VGC9_9BILA|nr:hypothetical protein PFISCL1PPCAC_9018 [Pristionchus fissidentatus]
MLYTLALLSAFALVAAADCGLDNSCIEVYNNCPFPVWPGIQGSTLVEGGGFYLPAGKNKTICVPNGWTAGRIWGRTGCDSNFNCDTGFCGNKLQCEGRGGEPPVSTAEITLNVAGGKDYYHVSMLDGYNLPVLIDVVEGTFRTNRTYSECKRAGDCFKNLTERYYCPPELRVVKNRRIVGCKSACLAYNTDQYCCRGLHSTPRTCRPSNWPRNYHAIYKDACPKAHSYAYDVLTSFFFCRGHLHPSPTYRVQFC